MRDRNKIVRGLGHLEETNMGTKAPMDNRRQMHYTTPA
jgi:hypothetical protein